MAIGALLAKSSMYTDWNTSGFQYLLVKAHSFHKWLSNDKTKESDLSFIRLDLINDLIKINQNN